VETRATLRLTCIDAARDDFPRARERLKSLEAGIRLPALLREIQEAQARLAILSGDLRSIAGWQAHIQTEPAAVSAGQEEREAFTLARLRLAEGKVNEALEILKGRAAEAAANGRLRSQVTALCLEALAYQASSDSPHARGALVEALSLGQVKGLRRLFLDEGRRFAALLQALLASIPQRSLSLYAAALLHSFHTESVEGQVALAPVEPLSPGELRVLRLLVAGLTNREIAQELVLSVNTVKTHLKSIFRKLNARSREEARQAARELRLF
jgi:LuxR family maltose regulon positive regulatory protein